MIAVQNQNDYCRLMLSLAHEEAVKRKRKLRESLATCTPPFFQRFPLGASACKKAWHGRFRGGRTGAKRPEVTLFCSNNA